MLKRNITEYISVIILLVCIALSYLHYFAIAIIFFGLWYILYGFVGLAFFFSTARKSALSNIFLAMTLYPTLLPYRKAFYFWTKSVNLIQKHPHEIEKAFLLAKKVNIANLYTDNNKSMFFAYIATLYSDLGKKEEAFAHIQTALNIPHKKAIDEMLNRVYNEIAK